jgi:hypothetical protein
VIPRGKLLAASVCVLLLGVALAAYGFARGDTLGEVLAWIGSGLVAIDLVDLLRTGGWRDER